ncbi:MAG: type II secretion system F family protein [Candidatus Marinimicrobia bacterium]|nr:type II secretion system F family protein [Candidatus Neomarinimicrobiota bacterium]
MPEFICKLVTEEGNVLETTIEASSKYEIYEQAEQRNELILSVKEHKERFDFQSWFDNLQKVKPQEIEHFTTQLGIMLDAGVPLLSALEAITEQSETEKMKNVVKSLAEQLNSGSSLSQAMRKYPKVFTLMYTNMIEAGEKAGVMDIILKRLSQFIGHDIQVRASVKSAMRYPIIIFCALILAFTGAILFVIPKFATMFKSQGIELPMPTRILIGINAAVTQYWAYTLVAVIVVVTSLIMLLRTPRGKYVSDVIKLKFPIFKLIVLKSTVARFAHMLETLSRGGIQIISALETVEKTVGNQVIGNEIAAAREKVAEGVSLAEALGTSKHFPPMTLKMISVGEQSGALDEMLSNIAKQYDNEVDHLIKRLSTMIEPMMTVIMGAFILLIALGIFLPMWRMYEVF